MSTAGGSEGPPLPAPLLPSRLRRARSLAAPPPSLRGLAHAWGRGVAPPLDCPSSSPSPSPSLPCSLCRVERGLASAPRRIASGAWRLPPPSSAPAACAAQPPASLPQQACAGSPAPPAHGEAMAVPGAQRARRFESRRCRAGTRPQPTTAHGRAVAVKAFWGLLAPPGALCRAHTRSRAGPTMTAGLMCGLPSTSRLIHSAIVF